MIPALTDLLINAAQEQYNQANVLEYFLMVTRSSVLDEAHDEVERRQLMIQKLCQYGFASAPPTCRHRTLITNSLKGLFYNTNSNTCQETRRDPQIPAEIHKDPQSPAETHRIPKKLIESNGNTQTPAENGRNPQNPAESRRITQKAAEPAETCSNPQNPAETQRDICKDSSKIL